MLGGKKNKTIDKGGKKKKSNTKKTELTSLIAHAHLPSTSTLKNGEGKQARAHLGAQIEKTLEGGSRI